MFYKAFCGTNENWAFAKSQNIINISSAYTFKRP